MVWRPVAGLADANVGWESKVVWGKEQRGQWEIPKRVMAQTFLKSLRNFAHCTKLYKDETADL